MIADFVPETAPVHRAAPAAKAEICKTCEHPRQGWHADVTGYADEQPVCLGCRECAARRKR